MKPLPYFSAILTPTNEPQTFATAIPYALDLKALRHLSRLSYGTLLSLSPALAALAGLFLLGEKIGFLQWIALSFVMLASIGVTFKSNKVKTA